MPESLPSVLDVPFIFTHRPSALPPELRPAWRIAVLLLTLSECGRNGSSSLDRMYVLNWAIRGHESRASLMGVLEGSTSPDEVIVRYEPGLNRAIDFAVGEGLLRRSEGRIHLTPEGRLLADRISATQGVLEKEKQFLSAIKRGVTERDIRQLLTWGMVS